DTGEAIPRAAARPARKTSGRRYRLPSDHPPSQFGYPVRRRKKPAVATRAKRQSARSARERHHARKPGTSQSQKGEKSSSPRAEEEPHRQGPAEDGPCREQDGDRRGGVFRDGGPPREQTRAKEESAGLPRRRALLGKTQQVPGEEEKRRGPGVPEEGAAIEEK